MYIRLLSKAYGGCQLLPTIVPYLGLGDVRIGGLAISLWGLAIEGTCTFSTWATKPPLLLWVLQLRG